MIGNNTGRKAGYKPLDNRIEKIYEAEHAAVLRRDKLAAEGKERLDAVQKEYEAQRAKAEAMAQESISRAVEAARQDAAAKTESEKRKAEAYAQAYIQEAAARLSLAEAFIVQEIFKV